MELHRLGIISIVYALAVFILLLLFIRCLLQCLQRLIERCMKKILFLQQEGGDVGRDLKESDRTAGTARLLERDVLELVGYKPWEA